MYRTTNYLLIATATLTLTACPAPPDDPDLRAKVAQYLGSIQIPEAAAPEACRTINEACRYNPPMLPPLIDCESARQRLASLVIPEGSGTCTDQGWISSHPGTREPMGAASPVIYPPNHGNVIGTVGGTASR